MQIIVGTRGSKLALTQTKAVINSLQSIHLHIDFQIKVITTTGDKIQNVSLDKIGEKGLFVKEIEEQLLSKEIDLAIHSMKDMPACVPTGLRFSWIPKREDYRDALILNKGYKALEYLPKGAKIATGSKRREFQITKIRPDIEILPIRGNIDTRIRKMKEQGLDGIILAAAGLKRLGLYEEMTDQIQLLSKDIMLPSPAQGALGLEIREDDNKLNEIIHSISHTPSEIEVKCERAFLKAINGNCHIPIGALCTINDNEIILEGLLGDEQGKHIVRKKITGIIGDEENLGNELARMVLEEMLTYEG